MNEKIILAHGSGCRATRDLINDVILKHLGNSELGELNDSALLDLESGKVAFTTDSYTVTPLFFPGSDIGKLSVYGTSNDLAVMGARPLYLSLGFIIEEGLAYDEFEKVVRSIKEAKNTAGIEIVTGDTKVVEKGKCDKLFISTAGIGIIKYNGLSPSSIEAGDKVIINGSIGEHEIAVLLARGELKFNADICSDCAPLWNAVSGLIQKCKKIKFMRDATRGGVGVVLNEIVENKNFGIEIYEEKIPVANSVKAVSEMLGYDPLYLANEGKFIIVIDKDEGAKALDILRSAGYNNAAAIGEIGDVYKGKVMMNTSAGGRRILDYPYGTQLPRIC